LFGLFSIKLNKYFNDSSDRAQRFIILGIGLAILSDSSFNNFSLGFSNACPLTPPTPNELIPAMPV
jgi:hypothetical protein